MSEQPQRPYAAAPLSALVDTIWEAVEEEHEAAREPEWATAFVAALVELVRRVEETPGEEDRLRTDLMDACDLLGDASECLGGLGASDMADRVDSYLDRVAPGLPLVRVIGYQQLGPAEFPDAE